MYLISDCISLECIWETGGDIFWWFSSWIGQKGAN